MTEHRSSQAFKEKCQRALTHPLTLAAIVVLLVNDWVFKALWQNDWTTGKLSDLAWVVFASPLLAFLLSYVVGQKPLGQRTAFVVAYVGLPLLYLLFNSFDIIHKAILRVLTLNLVNVAGTVPDPADSLVIPLGLAIALWVWVRQGEMSPRSIWALTRPQAWPRLHRPTLSYSVAAIAIVASLASSPPSPDGGVTNVGLLEDGRLTAGRYERIEWTSSDGGFTWEKSDREIEVPVLWGGTTLETPHGIYEISEGKILLTSGPAIQEVYDGSFYKSFRNRGIQEVATRQLEYRRLSNGPIVVAYHPATGNLVTAMGIQGVLVGTPNDRWVTVAVGPYEPTDLSFTGKLLFFVRDTEFLLAILALGVASTAVAMSITSHRQANSRRAILLIVCGLGSWMAIPFLGFIVLAGLSLVHFHVTSLVVSSLVLAMAILTFFLVERYRFKKDLAGSCNNLSVILAGASILPALLTPMFITTSLDWEISSIWEILPSQVLSITALVFGLLALALSLPRVVDLPSIVVSLAVTCILVYLGFLIGIILFSFAFAKVIVLFMTVAASWCVITLRRRTLSKADSISGSESLS